MDQETKAFIEEVKKRDTYISLRFIEIDDYHKAHADRRELLKVIESQDKEIERMKDVLLLVLSDGDFYVGKEREWIGTKTAYMLRKVFGL